ncbi:MAG: vWA domain-containing protein [Polyangiales bacterium]|jgi:hypothetical protein
MGHGNFGSNGEIVLRVTFGFQADAADLAAWTTCFEHASKMLYHATSGTARIAQVVYANDSTGGTSADAWITEYGWSYFDAQHPGEPEGFFGTDDISMTLSSTAASKPFEVLHEFGHYAFGLGDEYSPTDSRIKCTAKQQQLVAPGVDNPNVEQACIMGARPINNSGYSSTDPVHGWITEFCNEANHLHNPGTSHAIEHGDKSCEEVIQQLYPNVEIARGSPKRDFTAFSAPVWTPADPGSEIVLVANGAEFGPAAGATPSDVIMEAANYFSESASSANDSVELIPYETPVPHLNVPAQPSVAQAVEVAAKTIKRRARQRVTRTIVVFATSSAGLPSMSERAKELARDGIRVVTVGLGQNQATLQALAQETNGAYYEANPSHDVNKVRDDVMSFVDELRLGPPIFKLSSDSITTRKKTVRIDEGARRIKFVLSHPPNAGLRLSAAPINPAARAPGHISVLSNPKRSYQTLTVDQPVPGKWKVEIQGLSDAPFTLTAYSDNPKVRVGVTGAERLYRRGDEVTLHTVVSCPSPVVGLSRAVAKVTSPKGKTKTHRLKKGRGGVHSATFRVKEPGSYEVQVIVRNKGRARPAGLASEDLAAFDAAFKIPKFRRVKRFRVHVV